MCIVLLCNRDILTYAEVNLAYRVVFNHYVKHYGRVHIGNVESKRYRFARLYRNGLFAVLRVGVCAACDKRKSQRYVLAAEVFNGSRNGMRRSKVSLS